MRNVVKTVPFYIDIIIPSLQAILLYKKDRRGGFDLRKTTIVALKCGKKRPLYSVNEEPVVHSWRASEWGENERNREKEKEQNLCAHGYFTYILHAHPRVKICMLQQHK